MADLRMLEARIRVHLYRVEVIVARLRAYAAKFRELEGKALTRAEESNGRLRAFYLREAQNARFNGEVLEHMASLLEHLLRVVRERGLSGPTARLVVDDVLEELSRIKVGSLFSGSPAILVAEAEAALHELARTGGA